MREVGIVRQVIRTLALASASAAALALTVVVAPAASAAPGDYVDGGDGGHGYTALAGHVSYSGDTGGNGTPSFNGGTPPFVPCVWGDSLKTNAEMADWAKVSTRDGQIGADGSEYMGAYDGHRAPSQAEFEAHRNDTSGAWYLKDCVVPPDMSDAPMGSAYEIQQLIQQITDPATPAIVWSTTGPPPPPVTPQMLVWFAERELLLLAPAMRQNPAGEGVVRLPTWFWSTDRDVRVVRASVGAVWAEAEATPDRISVRAAGPDPGAVDCPDLGPNGAAAGGAASSCSITFGRAGSYALSATTAYTALWRGSDGTGGGLDPKTGPTWTRPPYIVNEVQVLNPGN